MQGMAHNIHTELCCALRYFPTILIVLLAVFNDGAMIALSKDRVRASPLPDVWNLRNIFLSGEHCSAILQAARISQFPHAAASLP